MLGKLQVSELAELAPGRWRVSVTFETYKAECELSDPFAGLAVGNEERLRWVLEDYPTLSPYDVAKAQECIRELDGYGKSLGEQLGLVEIFKGFTEALEEADVVVLDVSEKESGSRFLALHWEAIAHAYPVQRPYMPYLAVRRVIRGSLEDRLLGDPAVTEEILQIPSPPAVGISPEGHRRRLSSLEPDSSKPSVPARRKFNILMVVSRPDKRDDIDPLLASQALVKVEEFAKFAQKEMDQTIAQVLKNFPGARGDPTLEMPDIGFEIVRPGSWVALKECLALRKQEWEEKGGQGSWFDLVHFDVHGALWKNEAHLLFLDGTGRKTLWKSATKVGRLLQKHGISFVVLNSCESAKVTASPLSNLAKTLVESGVRSAIAMSFKFTSSAAEIFCGAFYTRLFRPPGPPDIVSALLAGRGALDTVPVRKGRFNREVKLPDFVIPVLYVNSSAAETFLPWRNHSGERYRAFSDLENNGIQLAMLWAQSIPKMKKMQTYGREHDILEMEWTMLNDPECNVVLLNGLPGIGKTAFLKLLQQWWNVSGLISSSSYLSFREKSPENVIQALKDFIAGTFEGKRRLFIVDDLDIVTSAWTGAFQSISNDEKSQLADLAKEAVGGNDLCIFSSRLTEPWLGLPEQQVYHLDGLSSYESGRLAVACLENLGLGDIMKHSSSDEFLCYLTSRFQYNPLAIEIFFKGIKESKSNWPDKAKYFESLDTFFAFLSALNMGSWVYIDYVKNLRVHECYRYIGESLTAGIYVAYRAVAMVPISGVFDWGWLDFAYKLPEDTSTLKLSEGMTVQEYRENQIREASEAKEFVRNYWLRSGWMEEFQVDLSEGRTKTYVRVHPVFTNVLRCCIVLQPDQTWHSLMAAFYSDFADYHVNKCLELSGVSSSRETIVTTQVEAANYMQCFWYCIDHERFLQATTIFRLLWDVAQQSRTPALATDQLTRCRDIILYTAEKLCATRSISCSQRSQFSQELMNTCIRVARLYMLKAPRTAAEYAKKGLNHAIIYLKDPGSWNEEIGRCVLVLLLLRGYAFIQIGRKFEDAEHAALLSKRLLPGDKAVDDTFLYLVAKLLENCYYNLDRDEAEQQVIRLDAEDRLRGLANHAREIESDETLDEEYIGDFILHRLLGFRFGPSMTNLIWSLRAVEERKSKEDATSVFAELKEQELIHIEEAQQHGDHAAEYGSHIKLVELSMFQRDWWAAGQHISQIIELHDSFDGGDVQFNSPDDRLFRWARYGTVWLRLRMLPNAIANFEVAAIAREAKDHYDESELNTNDIESPDEYLDAVVRLCRRNLFFLVALPRKLITTMEYYELDDLVQELLQLEIRKRWPAFDAAKPKAQERLKRRFTIDEVTRAIVSNNEDDSLLDLLTGFTGLISHTGGKHGKSKLKGKAVMAKRKVLRQREVQDLDEYNLNLAPLEELITSWIQMRDGTGIMPKQHFWNKLKTKLPKR